MGVLAVSRSFGDIEYKTLKERAWHQRFSHDIVVAEPVRPAPHDRSAAPGLASSLALAQDTLVLPVTAEHSFLLLACDGLWDELSASSAVHFVCRYLTEACRRAAAAGEPVDPLGMARGAAEAVARKALELCSKDNVSTIIVLL